MQDQAPDPPKGCLGVFIFGLFLWAFFTWGITILFRYYDARVPHEARSEWAALEVQAQNGLPEVDKLEGLENQQSGSWVSLGDIEAQGKGVVVGNNSKPGRHHLRFYPLRMKNTESSPNGGTKRYWGVRLVQNSGENAHENISNKIRMKSGLLARKPARVVGFFDCADEKPLKKGFDQRLMWGLKSNVSALPYHIPKIEPFTQPGIVVVELFYIPGTSQKPYTWWPFSFEWGLSWFFACFPVFLICAGILIFKQKA